MTITATALQPYTPQKMGLKAFQQSEVPALTAKMFIEQPFLPQNIIAEMLGVTRSRINAIVKGMGLEEQREQAQKAEIKRIKALYRIK